MNTENKSEILSSIELYSEFKAKLEELKANNDSLIFDYETPKGNKEARSHIYSLRKINASLESARKDAKASALEYGRLVDSKAKEIAAELAQMIEVHEKPLREIEEREAARIAAIQSRIDTLYRYKHLLPDSSAETIKNMLVDAEGFCLDDSLQEFKSNAAIAKDEAIIQLKVLLSAREAYESEQAELARLRQAEIARQQKEREDRIAREAAEQAKKQAEEMAEAKRQKDLKEQAEREQKAKDAALAQQLAIERAIREKAEAEVRAERAEREAMERAKQELAKKQEADKKEQEAREADKKHKAAINNKAVDALVLIGLQKQTAIEVITAIAKKQIPSVTIQY